MVIARFICVERFLLHCTTVMGGIQTYVLGIDAEYL